MVAQIMASASSRWSKIWEDSLQDQHWRSKPTDFGHEHEPAAAAAFWAAHPEYDEVRPLADGEMVEWADPDHELYGFAGGSPDRRLVVDGKIVAGLEIKCPYNQANHLRYAMMVDIPAEHEWQTRWYMEVQQVDTWWFVSYDPRLRHMKEIRVCRDQRKAELMLNRVLQFKRHICGESG